MIPRYTPADFEELWSDKTRFDAWLSVELAACDAMEEAGLVPKGTAESIRKQRLVLDPERILAIEQTTRHDVKAVEYYLRERMESSRG